MWPTNTGFPNNGQYQPNFNQDDASSANTPLPSPFSGVGSATNFFQQPNIMQQYDEMNIDSFNGFSPDVSMYNQAPFAQNKFIAPTPAFSSQLNSTNYSAPPTLTLEKQELAAKTAALKALLMKSKGGHAKSTVPPVSASTKQITAKQPSSSLQHSPTSPALNSDIDEHLRREKEINDLISDYSETKPKINREAGNGIAKNPLHMDTSILSMKSQASLLGSPRGIIKPQTNSGRASNATPAESETRHAESGSMSEGEILDEPTPKKLPPTEPKGNQINTKSANVNEKSSISENDQTAWSPYTRVKLEEPGPLIRGPASGQPSRPEPPRYRKERREESDFRTERKFNGDHRHEKKSQQDIDQKHHPHKFPGEPIDENRQPEVSYENAKSVRESKLPTLAQVLPHDADLREWLDVTQYHDSIHRNKVLKTARALKDLDDQKAKLLADIQDDQSLVKYNMGSLMTGLITQPQNSPAIMGPTDFRDRVTSNKRNYSELQDLQEEAIYGKAARLEDRDDEFRRRQSSVDYNFSRRANGDRGGRSKFREFRNRGRSLSNDREVSPGLRAYESRPPARERSLDSGCGRRRAYEVHGSYKGRSFDPNYRGRGRGRGRGDWGSHESRGDGGFGSRNALGRSYKDSKGSDREGKGGQ